MRRRLTALTALAFGGALLLATIAPVGAAGTAMVRVMHASPDAPAVDVYVDGSAVLKNVEFKTISAYLKVPAGTHDLGIKAAPSMASDAYVLEAKGVAVAAGKAYTVAATGKLADIAFTILADNPNAKADTAKLRVVHFSPDAPAVDVALKGQAPDAAPVKGLVFPKATGYLSLPGDTYDFEVRLAGTTTVALDLAGTTLEDGKNYSVFAVGLATADPATLGVVVAVDGTIPATSTESSGSGSSPIPFVAFGVLAAAGVALLFGRRLASVRSR